MEYQKFIPEGWYNTKEEFSINKIENAMKTGKVIQGFAYRCDENYNIHVKLGENINGIIPNDELDIGITEQTKIGICKSKINNFVQFKIKENPFYLRYLRSHSYWYKILNRDYNSFKIFEEEVKREYRLTKADRLENMFNSLEMIEKILSTFK